MFSVRFHLARGPHYRHWQVKDLKDKDVQIEYFDPLRYQLFLTDCELVCNERTAQQVYSRGVKDVCGWIKCGDVCPRYPDLHGYTNIDYLPCIKFNPIVDPNWRIEGRPEENWNGRKVDEIVTAGHRCYLYSESFAHGV